MLNLAATIVHRITGKEYKIERFFDQYRASIEPKWAKILNDREDSVMVDLGDGVEELYNTVNSSLYMTKEEYEAMTSYVDWLSSQSNDPTVIIFDKQSGMVYREKDFVPNPR